MSEEMTVENLGYILVIVAVLLVSSGIIIMIYKTGIGKRILLDFAHWIPGMSRVINLLGGAG